MKPLLIFISLFMLAGMQKMYAGDTLSDKYPSAVLVQLRSEYNKIEAMIKNRDYKDLEEVKKDALEVKRRMILDFTQNFHYCPVYYYIDTNVALINNKEFDGALLNADGTPVTNPIINGNSDDYLIVYYGYALSQPKSSKIVKDTDEYSYDPDSRPGRGLVILNDKFQQIGHFYKLGGYAAWIKKKQYTDYYVSKHFDIDYFPFAKTFNDRLKEKRPLRNAREATHHTN